MASADSSSSGRSHGAHRDDDAPADASHARGRSRTRRRDGGTDEQAPAAKSIDRTSPAELDKAALRYLNRYDASVEQLRRVLFRHVQRHASGAALSRARDDVRALLERYQASRLLDDARYAEALGRGLRARGSSAMSIRMKLRQRGVAEEVTESALERLAAHAHDDDADPELAAARAFVRRKRLTKRHDVGTPEGRNKALGSLGRQGFPYSVASAALAAEMSEAQG
jgi:regulatory protein